MAVQAFTINGFSTGLTLNLASLLPLELDLKVTTTTGAWPSPKLKKPMFEYKLYVTGMIIHNIKTGSCRSWKFCKVIDF